MQIKIMMGCSGSGKSTHISGHWPEATVFSADQYFTRSGRYEFDPRKLGEAHAQCLRRYAEAVSDDRWIGATLVVDNTNATMQEIAPYCALALAYGRPFEIVMVRASPEVSAMRNVHGVPLDTVRRQADRCDKTWRDLPSYWPKRYA
jgi:predicted kinase